MHFWGHKPLRVSCCYAGIFHFNTTLYTMKHALPLLMIFFGTLSCIFGQNDAPKTRSKADFYTALQIAFYDFGRMNQDFSAVGYPTLQPDIPTALFAFRFQALKNKRWLNEAALEFSRVSSSGFMPSGRDINLRDWAFTNRFLYDCLPSKKGFKIYPHVGLGLHYQQLRLYDGIRDINSFDKLVREGISRITLSDWVVHGELGLSLEKRILLGGSEIFFVLRGGYMAMLRDDWTIDGDYQVSLSNPGIGVPYFNFGFRFR